MSRREPDRFAPLAERLAWGKSRRKALPRVAQAEWRARPSRPDPVDVLLAASRGRVPELLPIKWGRMAASPFGFFRGAVPVMARDLASQRVSGLTVQMCGDAHVRNLGAYAAADGHLVFDINDLDETMPGPWEWDLKRLAASFVLAGPEAGARKLALGDAPPLLPRPRCPRQDRRPGRGRLLLHLQDERVVRRGPEAEDGVVARPDAVREGARADRRRGCARGLRREVRPPRRRAGRIRARLRGPDRAGPRGLRQGDPGRPPPRGPLLRRGAGSGRYWAPKESP